MAYDRFMIAPLNSGLQRNVKPFAIPDEAFAELTNMYVFRGRLRKRFGSRLMNPNVAAGPDPLYPAATQQLYSRLRESIGVTDGMGDLAPTVILPNTIGAIGQMFSVGTQIFTVYQPNGVMLNTGTGTGTFDTATATITITGATAGATVYFYPALPVMGIATYDQLAVNDEYTIAFDTRFAYMYTNGGWERIGSGGVAPGGWTGTDSQFFWWTNWRGTFSTDRLLFVSNYNAADGIQYWNGAIWAILNPFTITAGNKIISGRIIVPFKGRLIILNTIETDGTHPNRCRYSQVGDPLQADAWKQAPGMYGKGGFVDAPTNEAIITAEFIKDRLIVYFERSTWELAYNGNQQLPFVWQQINTELGAESTFSVIPFDKVILGIGQTGVHACNGANTDRIDGNIPDEVFNIHNDDGGVERVYGIRDYYVEQVYWAMPDPNRTAAQPYPNRVLVYNYKTRSWAFNNDSITAFGYYQPANTAVSPSWDSTDVFWDYSSVDWGGGALQAKFRNVLAGNQEGWMFIIDPDNDRNAQSLQITNIDTSPGNGKVKITCINHNFTTNDQSEYQGPYVYIDNLNGLTFTVGEPRRWIYQVTLDSLDPLNPDTIIIQAPDIVAATGVYTGGGTMARVSNINVLTKQYNFYVDKNRNVAIDKVDFLVDKTTAGQFTVNVYASYGFNDVNLLGVNPGVLLGDNTVNTSAYSLYPLENTQQQLWRPAYLQAEGEAVQLRLYMTPEQITHLDAQGKPDTAFEDVQIHAIAFRATQTSNRLS